VRLCFLTSTPLNFASGSGTFTGITTLAAAVRKAGVGVDILNGTQDPSTEARLAFNREIAQADFSSYDATIGFDLDGFLLPRPDTPRFAPPHFACLKGVIADELRFETGAVREALTVQADYERQNVVRAAHVVTCSGYSAARIREFYAPPTEISVVPEPIDLHHWSSLLEAALLRPPNGIFTLLCVCRFYPRKRLSLLLDAMALLPSLSPGTAVALRIVGNGPERDRLHAQARLLNLAAVCQFLGDLDIRELAAEYRNCNAFVFPSGQEGFGIVLLEAMAAGKPIIATRSAAIPEVVPHALFAGGDKAEDLAHAIVHLATDEQLCLKNGEQGRQQVMQFDASRVARHFIELIESKLPVNRAAERRAAAFSSADGSTSIGPDIAG
jgi:glycosyltransferase involved in cell wall biosynthesis